MTGKKKKIEISRPFAVQEYNNFMGGVDMMDRMIAHYPHGFENRKWYLRIFFHLVNMAIVNSWILYRKSVDGNMSLLKFKGSVVWTMLELQKAKKRGRKSNSIGQKTPPIKRKYKKSIPTEITYDNIDHYPSKKETGQASRCRNEICTSRTRYTCEKCECSVCPKCMKSYHTE